MWQIGTIVVFFLVLGLASSQGDRSLDLHCLRVCECDIVSPPRGRNHTIVKCQNLTNFPESVPPGTTVLDLHNNGIKEITADSLTKDNLKYLKDFDCSNGKIMGIGLHSFRNVSHLKSIDLSSNKITKLEPTVFANLKHLTSVDLRNNTGLDCTPLQLALPKVEFLCDDFVGTPPASPTPPAVREWTTTEFGQDSTTEIERVSTLEAEEWPTTILASESDSTMMTTDDPSGEVEASQLSVLAIVLYSVLLVLVLLAMVAVGWKVQAFKLLFEVVLGCIISDE